MSDIIMSDDFVDEMASKLVKEANKLEQHVDDYIRLLKEIHERGIMEGNTADALSEFISIASKLNGIFADFEELLQITCDNYKYDFDEADEELY